ncbi:MAG: hypothetical protein FJZ01_27535 [Candidatus Sericytochromatia bacterium]|nr:hypothetical protein [Candidatus Tanganyikabacteria bacterium]
MTELSLYLLEAKRSAYRRGLLSLAAAGRALSECDHWHHDPERIARLTCLADTIRKNALETAESLRQIQALEARILG